MLLCSGGPAKANLGSQQSQPQAQAVLEQAGPLCLQLPHGPGPAGLSPNPPNHPPAVWGWWPARCAGQVAPLSLAEPQAASDHSHAGGYQPTHQRVFHRGAAAVGGSFRHEAAAPAADMAHGERAGQRGEEGAAWGSEV